MSKGGLGQEDLLQLVISALEMCETGVLIHDEHTILYANAKLAEQIEVPTAYTRIGAPIVEFLDYCAERGDFGPGVRGADIIARSLDTTRSGGVFETERTTPSGRSIRARIAGLPDGGAIATYNDVSALVTAKHEASELARDMEQRVVARTRDLVEAKEKAENANRAKTQFLANMSHELRTPLNAVIGYSEILQEDVAAGELAESPKLIENVLGAAKHLLGMIDDLLSVAQLESGKVSVQPEWIDARLAAEGAVRAVAPSAAAYDAPCELVVDAGVEEVMADPARLHQCLMNLLSNATKFGAGKPVKAHVRAAQLQGGAAVAFDVIDHGVGMSEDTQAKLFQPFMLGDESSTRAHDGAGLGLAITRSLVELMHGELSVESALGEGSRFSIVLPAR